MTAALDQLLGSLKGIGAKRALLFERLGLRTLEDLFWYFPRRYEDRRTITPLKDIQSEGHHVVAVFIDEVERSRTRRYSVFRYTASLRDGEGVGRAVWFGGQSALRGFDFPARVLLYGKVRVIGGVPEFTNPEMERGEKGLQGEEWGCVLPIYPLTEGLGGKWLRKFIHAQLKAFLPDVKETLPEAVTQKRRLLPLDAAIMGMHRPQSERHWALSRKRLAYEECFHYRLALERQRQERLRCSAPAQIAPDVSPDLFFDHLPFIPTASQKKAVAEMLSDMREPLAMHRLLQGDVGSGKTVVALAVAFCVLQSGYSVALMAPTTLLASQLHEVARLFFAPFAIPCHLLTGSTPMPQRQEIEAACALAPCFVAGTHALFTQGVCLPRLGLVIIDEQHRFGVAQRALFASKGDYPHILTMSGTPIPRTLCLALYGELPISTLTEKPAGRIAVQTRRVAYDRVEGLLHFIQKEITDGGQVYWVCPLIEGGEEEEREDAALPVEERFARLKKALPDVSIALLHGRMGEEEKEATLRAFLKKETLVLVATTVVEVGVDVPSATVMVVEGASSFGLAQLHQLRGRVGRGSRRSFCFLLDSSREAAALGRLAVLEKSEDGFYIAQQDLLLRGQGDIAGSRQHGESGFRLMNFAMDARLMECATQDAREYLCAADDHRV